MNDVIDIIEHDDFNSASVFIEPPDVRELTDEDSGYECYARPSNFTGRQLRARATLTLKSYNGKELLGETVSEIAFITSKKIAA